MRWFKFLPLLVAVVIVGTLAVSPAIAGRGGTKGKPADSSATLWVSPSNPFPAYGYQFTIGGSGFTAGQDVHFALADPGCCTGFAVMADSSGGVSFPWKTGDPGTYLLRAFQKDGSQMVLKASVSFTVQ